MPNFNEPEAIAERIHNNPASAVALLEANLTEPQIAAFEAALLPEPAPEERNRVLRETVRLLKRAGLPESDAVVAAIRREIEPAE